MPLPITGYAPLNGWRQVGAPHWSYMEAHTFEASPKGELLHFTNGELRATVPPEGFGEYAALWPMAEDLARQLARQNAERKAHAAADAKATHQATRATVLAELKAAGFTITPPAPSDPAAAG